MSAPFHDPRPDCADIEVWPPAVDLSPELITLHVRRAHHLRLATFRAVFRRLAALFGWAY